MDTFVFAAKIRVFILFTITRCFINIRELAENRLYCLLSVDILWITESELFTLSVCRSTFHL